jgi:hypothetical protein
MEEFDKCLLSMEDNHNGSVGKHVGKRRIITESDENLRVMIFYSILRRFFYCAMSFTY